MDHGNMDHSHHGHMMTTGDGTSDGVDHSMHGGMMMYFHFSTQATILFKGWETNNWGEMLGSCIAVFVMAALYEGLKVGREQLLKRTRVMVPADNDAATGTLMNGSQPKPAGSVKITSLAHILQSFLHIVQVVVSYFLMLIFMTYNGWLCIATALGAGCGYFLFCWKRAVIVDINEHCH